MQKISIEQFKSLTRRVPPYIYVTLERCDLFYEPSNSTIEIVGKAQVYHYRIRKNLTLALICVEDRPASEPNEPVQRALEIHKPSLSPLDAEKAEKKPKKCGCAWFKVFFRAKTE